ncbi:MAG: DUF58 domain-containing protein [Candidatus Sumerlaeota bacterium]|nr:DUF58 domain-containing protein [Candidatus Sumerlaeota bacterium]
MLPSHKKTSWIEDPDLFMAMEDLEMVARGVVEGMLHGLHRSPYIGFSVEFDSHREYQIGDDLRYVNWNLWGRTDRLYVKLFKSDTNLNLYLMMDVSGSMLTAHGPTEKWKYGARAAAALAFLALNGRDATGAFLLGGRVEQHIPPRVRPGQFVEILAMLQNAKPGGLQDVALGLEEARQLCKRRGMVIFISDLFDREDAILKGLSNLRYLGHEVIVIQVLDPWEAQLPERGQYQFHDLETDELIQTYVTDVREAYQRIFNKWQSDFRRKCEDAGIDWVQCLTTDPLRNILIDYLLRRANLY